MDPDHRCQMTEEGGVALVVVVMLLRHHLDPTTRGAGGADTYRPESGGFHGVREGIRGRYFSWCTGIGTNIRPT
jgi:hypothetical protein